MVIPAKLASAKCIAVFVFCLLYYLSFFFCFVDCLFNWST